jgi:hypothetical protein
MDWLLWTGHGNLGSEIPSGSGSHFKNRSDRRLFSDHLQDNKDQQSQTETAAKEPNEKGGTSSGNNGSEREEKSHTLATHVEPVTVVRRARRVGRELTEF